MRIKTKLFAFVFACGVGLFASSICSTTRGEEPWGRYYHYPYHNFHQYQYTPYDYQPNYGNYRYPPEQRVFPKRHGYRSWLPQTKPYYRGYHFILDRF